MLQVRPTQSEGLCSIRPSTGRMFFVCCAHGEGGREEKGERREFIFSGKRIGS